MAWLHREPVAYGGADGKGVGPLAQGSHREVQILGFIVRSSEKSNLKTKGIIKCKLWDGEPEVSKGRLLRNFVYGTTEKISNTTADAIDELIATEQLIGAQWRQWTGAGSCDEQSDGVEYDWVDGRRVSDPAHQQTTDSTAAAEHWQ